MTAEVPEGLIREIAERRCIIFLGAGATMAARKQSTGAGAPSWNDLLKELASSAPGIQVEVERYLSEHRPLDAAQLIRTKCTPGRFRDVLQDRFERAGLSAGRLHELVNAIDPKIVLTTNYDSIYEDFCNSGRAGRDLAYRVKNYYDQGVPNDIRSPNSVILKLHGSVADPERTVLSRTDYFRARSSHAGFFEVVKALILTNTVLFVGCSVDTDPHIQLFMEWASGALHQDLPHYAIVPDVHNDVVYAGLSETMNMEFIRYPSGEHDHVITILEDVCSRVELHRAMNFGI